MQSSRRRRRWPGALRDRRGARAGGSQPASPRQAEQFTPEFREPHATLRSPSTRRRSKRRTRCKRGEWFKVTVTRRRRRRCTRRCPGALRPLHRALQGHGRDLARLPAPGLLGADGDLHRSRSTRAARCARSPSRRTRRPGRRRRRSPSCPSARKRSIAARVSAASSRRSRRAAVSGTVDVACDACRAARARSAACTCRRQVVERELRRRAVVIA